jgi:hypothetical protein
MDEENIGVAILDNTGGEETCTKYPPHRQDQNQTGLSKYLISKRFLAEAFKRYRLEVFAVSFLTSTNPTWASVEQLLTVSTLYFKLTDLF